MHNVHKAYKRKAPELLGGVGELAESRQFKADQGKHVGRAGSAAVAVFLLPALQGAQGCADKIGGGLLSKPGSEAHFFKLGQGFTTFLKGNKPPRTGAAGSIFFFEFVKIDPIHLVKFFKCQ